MNNLLLLESMDSAAFFIDAHMLPRSNMSRIAEKSSVLAREKGINFVVNNEFGELILNEVLLPPSSGTYSPYYHYLFDYWRH